MLTKRILPGVISIILILLLISSVCFIFNTPWYKTTDYELKIPSSFQISSDDENILIYQAEKNVGGITHYTESTTYDALINLLQNGEQWSSYSLESDNFADKLLTFVNTSSKEYHHYIYRTQNKGIYDLWFCTNDISEENELMIAEQFKIKQ